MFVDILIAGVIVLGAAAVTFAGLHARATDRLCREIYTARVLESHPRMHRFVKYCTYNQVYYLMCDNGPVTDPMLYLPGVLDNTCEVPLRANVALELEAYRVHISAVDSAIAALLPLPIAEEIAPHIV